MIIFRQPGANIIDTVDRITPRCPRSRRPFPPGINMDVMLDRTTTIRASVFEVERTLLIAILLVILVVFLFLRNGRATLIPAVVVPVSLIGTFGVMYLCGYSLDNLSLMALTISTGFVVDDAIVVIENITRYLEQGMSAVEAALQGAREVGFTVLSISLSLVAVFTPILLMGGIVGPAVPRICRDALDGHPGFARHFADHHADDVRAGCSGIESRGSRTDLSRERTDFCLGAGTLPAQPAVVLQHPAFTLGHSVADHRGRTFILFTIVPKGIFPAAGQWHGVRRHAGRAGRLVSGDAIGGAAVRQHHHQRSGRVATVMAFTGGSGAANGGFIYMALKPLNERKISASQVINRLRPKLGAVPGATVFVQAGQDLRIGGRQSNAQYQYTIQSDNLDDLVKWGPILLEQMKKLHGFTRCQQRPAKRRPASLARL